jgi:glycosyl transferase family 28
MLRSLRNIDFMFFDAGGGHRSAANALKLVIEQQQRPWSIRLVNLQELLDPLDVFRKMTGVRLQDIYNRLLAKGWTLGSEWLLPPMHGIIRLYHRGEVRMLREFWSHDTPDMVVSLVPNLNRAMFEGLRQVSPSIPYVTILTDFADYPPHFWIEPQPQHLICGTEKAVEQARAMGYPDDHVSRTSGMILHPRYYETPQIDRAAERRRLNLDPDRPTGLVLFGGQGSSVMYQIFERLQDCRRDLQLIFICGRNERLKRRLQDADSRIPVFVEGFTSEVPYYMRLSDFFIGKPGPGSISEAIALGLPVIVERNSWTLPQERYNTEWVREKGVGVVLSNFQTIASAVEDMLEPAAFERYQASAQAIHNRAIYEIPDILQNLLPGT